MIVTSLIENLEAQVEWHELLLEVLKLQEGLAAKTTLTDVEDLVGQRSLITKQIYDLETGRLKMVEAFVKEHQMEPDANLEAIACKLDDEQGASLRALKAQLMDLVEPIREFGQAAAAKAQARSNCFNEVHQSLHRTFKRAATYSQYGQVRNPQGSVYLTRSI